MTRQRRPPSFLRPSDRQRAGPPRNDAAPLAGGAGVNSPNSAPELTRLPLIPPARSNAPRGRPNTASGRPAAVWIASTCHDRSWRVREPGRSVPMTTESGGPGLVQWLRAIGDAHDLSGRETATLNALLRFADWQTGKCWPTVAQLAAKSKSSERTMQRGIGELVVRGVVKLPAPRRGGPRGRGTTYFLDYGALRALATGDKHAPVTGDRRVPVTGDNGNTDGCQGGTPRVTNATPTGDRVSPKPTREQPLHHHQVEPAAVVDVFTRLGIEHLRGHENATPARMSWIERAAPKMRNPGGWAAKCIREGWAVLPPTEEEVKAQKRARRDATLMQFDTMSEPERRAVLVRAWAAYPNLVGMPDDAPAVRGAVAQIMDPDAGQADWGVNKL